VLRRADGQAIRRARRHSLAPAAPRYCASARRPQLLDDLANRREAVFRLLLISFSMSAINSGGVSGARFASDSGFLKLVRHHFLGRAAVRERILSGQQVIHHAARLY